MIFAFNSMGREDMIRSTDIKMKYMDLEVEENPVFTFKYAFLGSLSDFLLRCQWMQHDENLFVEHQNY